MDKYFKHPILFDYLISVCISGLFYYLYFDCIIHIPEYQRSLSISSDLANIGMTLAGFILTLLTVLITFKSNSKSNSQISIEEESLFELFFSSDLYFITVSLLKDCIKSLVFISFLGYFLKSFLSSEHLAYMFFYNIIGLIVIPLTIYRCLFILTKVLKLQEK